MGVRLIERFLNLKVEEASVWTARKYYGALASAFETAVRCGYLKENPFRKIKKPAVVEIHPVYFTQNEYRRLIDIVKNSTERDLYDCAVLTGLRLRELLSLRWGNIDFDRRLIHARNGDGFATKSKRDRTIPVNAKVEQVLRVRYASRESDLVFHEGGEALDPTRVSKRFKWNVRRADIDPRLHFHSLRHTFATWMVQAGVPLYNVQKVLGHSSIITTQIYAHLSPDELHNSVDRITLT